jgi:hypothetical protein
VPANVSTQFKETGNVSFTAVGAVTGRRFVVSANPGRTGGPGLSGDLKNQYRFAQAAGGAAPILGVAKYDVADGESGGVHGQPGMIVELEAGAALAPGTRVTSGADGRAVALAAAGDPAAAVVIGNGSAAAGDILEAKLVLA